MPLEIDQQTLQLSLKILKLLGATSLAGFLSLYTAWLTLPPELVIEGVIDKSKALNSESKIKIKNNGFIPAYSVRADVENLCAEIMGNTFKNCGFYGGPILIGKLTHNESTEITVKPGIAIEGGAYLNSFSYVLILNYQAKLFFFKKNSSKRWMVKLNNFSDGYSWETSII